MPRRSPPERDADRPSIGSQLPTFIIPPGTQVVLKAGKRIPRTDQVKPAGSVGEVMGQELRTMRDAFLSKHLYKTYSGYVLSQFRRLRNSLDKKGTFKVKHAMHLIRLLWSGIHIASYCPASICCGPVESKRTCRV